MSTEDEIKELRKDLNTLIEEVRTLSIAVNKSNSKMGNHIDFVENVYSTLRYPLDCVIKRIRGKKGESLPLLLTDTDK